MKFLILGGAGFIGSNLAELILNSSKQNHVTVIDNFLTGSFDNVEHLCDDPRFRLYNFDIIDKYWTDSEETLCDVIFNLACPASPVKYQKHPLQTLKVCTEGVYNALLHAYNNKARILHASTSEVYGNPVAHPQPESYLGNVNSYGPRSCYDEGKRVAESYVYEFSKTGMDTRIVRIFNTYGPRMAVDDGRVVSNFIVRALKGEPLEVYGTGNQTRSLCYIDDLLQGMLSVMSSPVQSPVNLGNPVELTVLELAEKIITLTESSSRIIHLPLPRDDPERRRPDITLARSLGWEPKVALEDGLKKTITYFREVLK